MTQNSSQQRLIAIASVIILALLGASIYLLVSKNKLQEQNQQVEAQLEETNQLRDSLETQFNQAMVDLDGMKGTNAELNAIIEQQKSELAAQKSKISGLIGNKRKLNEAREEIKNLTSQVEQYIAQISQLQTEKAALADENTNLNTNLNTARANNQELMAAKATLVSEKESLETERIALAEKVAIGSVVKVGDVKVTGYKRRKSGKLADKKYAKNIDVLNMCFNLNPNKVVEAGSETFQVVIMMPDGTPMIGGTTSGSFKSKETGSEIRYTMEVTEKYSNTTKEVCIEYDNPDGYNKGTYNVELYNKGFLSGTGSFVLK